MAEVDCAIGSLLCCIGFVTFAPVLYYMVKSAMITTSIGKMAKTLQNLDNAVENDHELFTKVNEIHQIASNGIEKVGEIHDVVSDLSEKKLKEMLTSACIDTIMKKRRICLCDLDIMEKYNKLKWVKVNITEHKSCACATEIKP